MKKILRMRDVKSRTGLSQSLIYRLISEGKFPRQIKLTRHASGWDERAVDQWISERIAKSASEAA